MHRSAIPEMFAEIVQIGLSQSANYLDLPLEVYNLGLHDLKPNCSCLIIEDFADQAKFYEPSTCSAVIYFALSFRTTNGFGCFTGVIVQFELLKLNYLSKFL